MFENIKNLSKNSIETERLNKIVAKIPENITICEEVTKEILNIQNVQIVVEKDFKGNYYNGITNTITLSGKEKQETHMGRVMVVCHECIHAMQSKILHIINYIGSNIEILFFIVSLIYLFFTKNVNVVMLYIYNIIAIGTIIVRLCLELDAVYRSIGLSKKYLLKHLKKDETDNVITRYKKMQLLMIFPFIINIVFSKTIRLSLINILNIYF